MPRYLTTSLAALLFACIAAGICPFTASANTLAYWRFEGGRNAQPIAAVALRDKAAGKNDLQFKDESSRPFEANQTPFPTVPQTGTSNKGAAEFRGNDALVASAKLGAAWTIEFSLKLEAFDGSEGVLCLASDEGTSAEDIASAGGIPRGPLQIVATSPSGDQKYGLRFDLTDGADQVQSVKSPTNLMTGRWYNVAATFEGSMVRLYVDSLDGRGYQLLGGQAATVVTTQSLVLGRGADTAPGTRLSGQLDEVRLSDTALSPRQFLFSTPTGAGVTPPIPNPYPENDIKLFHGADPDIVTVGKKFYLYPTGGRSKSGDPVFYAFSSTDKKHWKRSGPVLNFKQIPWIYADGQSRHSPWAPTVQQKGDKFYFYYSVGDQSVTPSRIGVGVSDSPLGPFKDSGQALVTGGNGFEAIDPMVFTDPKSGQSYLYAGGSNGATLRVWRLSDDMMHLVEQIKVEQPPKFTEGVFMHFANGLYYLSYSHGGWHSPSYSVHYATSTSPLGPWTYHGAILVSDERRKGPGHHGFFQDPRSKQWFIVYHRWEGSNVGGDPFNSGGRSLAIQPIRYEKNGEITPIKMSDDVPVLER